MEYFWNYYKRIGRSERKLLIYRVMKMLDTFRIIYIIFHRALILRISPCASSADQGCKRLHLTKHGEMPSTMERKVLHLVLELWFYETNQTFYADPVVIQIMLLVYFDSNHRNNFSCSICVGIHNEILSVTWATVNDIHTHVKKYDVSNSTIISMNISVFVLIIIIMKLIIISFTYWF